VALRLAELVRDSGAISSAVEAARLLLARENGGLNPRLWEELAGQRKDTKLYMALKNELELAQCSFFPNLPPRAVELLDATQGSPTGGHNYSSSSPSGGGGGLPLSSRTVTTGAAIWDRVKAEVLQANGQL